MADIRLIHCWNQACVGDRQRLQELFESPCRLQQLHNQGCLAAVVLLDFIYEILQPKSTIHHEVA